MSQMNTSKVEPKAQENTRASKGLIMAGKSFVRKIEPQTTGATLYKVKSENPRIGEYRVVVHTNGEVSCDCPDYLHRNATCKHIYAVVFSDQMGFTIVSRTRHTEKVDLTGSEFTL